MLQFILSGLLLPLRLYFRPRSFSAEVAALAPGLHRNYNLWQARDRLRDPASRHGLARLAAQALIALIWTPLIALLISGYSVPWGIVAANLAIALAGGVLYTVTYGVAFGLAFIVVFGLAYSISLVVTLILGIAMAAGAPVSALQSMPVGQFGSLVASLVFGMALGTAFNVALSVRASTVLGLMIGVAVGLTGSIVSGAQFGANLGAAFAVSYVLVTAHLLNLPFEYLAALAGWSVIRFAPALSSRAWRISLVRWDDIILLPLPGLDELLATLYRRDRALGQAALTEVSAHRYQRRAAHHALIQLAREEAESVASLPGLAGLRGLDWLSDDVQLPDDVRRLVLGLRDISREVQGALESNSAVNRVRRFEAAADQIATLRLSAGEFGAALERWSGLVETGLQEARRQQQIEEPIPQVYIGDGRPIRPTNRDGQPFKGRTALFRQLEAALGGQEGERTTLLLYGQRRTGKTSILMQLPRRLGSRMVPAFIDLQSAKLGGAQDAPGFLAGLAGEVADEARRHRGVSLPVPDRKALADDPYPAFGRWLDKVEQALGDRVLLLCLDEFEEMENALQQGRLDERILSALRSTVQHRRRIEVLLAGSHQMDELPPHWASSLITSTTLPISFLEEVDARELIERPVEGFPPIYTAPAVDRVAALTHCQPYLVQLMCALLVERMNTARRAPPASCVGVEDVEAVIPLALERGQNYFIDLWRNQAGGDTARRVLEALAACGPAMQASRVRLSEYASDDRALREALAILVRRELIERAGDGFRITVPLVGEYICRNVIV